MDLPRLQRNWTNLGRADPLGAILGDPRAPGEWDLEAFLQTGRDFLGYLERHLQGLGVGFARARAMDFGCGWGRLSQALALRFAEVVGVDIAATMLEGARAIDRSGGRCRFVHNGSADLSQFAAGSFDLVLSVLVLQHMRREYALGYLREFARVLRPGGVLVAQLAAEPLAAPGAVVAEAAGGAGVQLAGRTPAGELCAAISVQPFRAGMIAGLWTWLRVRVHNAGARDWQPARDGLQLGVRWCDLEGSPVAPLLLRALPGPVAAGGTVELLVPVRAPRIAPGPWLLRFQLVRDGTWIEMPGLGGGAVVASVRAGPRVAEEQTSDREPAAPSAPSAAGGAERAEEGGAGGEDEARIEVHGVPVSEVVATLAASGLEVVDVGLDDWAGPDWLSAHYVARRRAP